MTSSLVAADPGETLIEARELTKRYGPVLAVDKLSFRVLPGHVTGFLGPNGAGKSTTLRMILGLDAPTSGEVLVNGGCYVSLVRPLHQVGALLDAGAVHGGRSAFNHLLCIAQSNGVGRGRVREVLQIAGIDKVAGQQVGGFSLGMRQRLGIAGALLGDPAVLIFDEPVNGLDPDGVQWIRGLLSSLAGEGRTVFVASHLMSEMAITADRVIVIGRGKLIADASVAELVRSSSLGDVLVRSPRAVDLARLLTDQHAVVTAEPAGGLAVSGLDAPAISELAAGHGIPVYELTTRHATLEEAYMELADGTAQYHAGAAGQHGTDTQP
jgi:ABC-2 type transport system ATP-binding protein